MGSQFMGPPWERVVVERPTRCDDCGRTVPIGGQVDIRHGEKLMDALSRSAYPNDPTTFCIPCVTPL